MQEKRQNIAPIKSRILIYIDSKGITKAEFCRNCNISESLFKGIGLTSEIGGEKLVNILSNYNDINPEWLLTGQGAMLRNPDQATASSAPGPVSNETETLRALLQSRDQEIERLNNIIELLIKSGANSSVNIKTKDLNQDTNQNQQIA